MLSDFFRINLPYGISRNDKGEWMAFNREYMPLGFNDYSKSNFKEGVLENSLIPVRTKYKKLSDSFLESLVDKNSGSVQRNSDGEIIRIFLYNDGTNPINTDKQKHWESYFKKLEKLSKLEALHWK